MIMRRFANVELILSPALFDLRADHTGDIFMNSMVIFCSFNNFGSES